jgi:hypothetical protein
MNNGIAKPTSKIAMMTIAAMMAAEDEDSEEGKTIAIYGVLLNEIFCIPITVNSKVVNCLQLSGAQSFGITVI